MGKHKGSNKKKSKSWKGKKRSMNGCHIQATSQESDDDREEEEESNRDNKDITNIMAMMKQLSPEEHINMLSELDKMDF